MSEIEKAKPVVNVAQLFQHARQEHAAGNGPLESGFNFKREDMDTYVPPPEVVAHRNPDLIGVELTPLVDLPEIGAEEAANDTAEDASEEIVYVDAEGNQITDPELLASLVELDPDTFKVEEAAPKPPIAMMLIGLPGSGKSTLSRHLRDMHNPDRTLVYVSSDQYIEDRAEEEGKTYGEVFREHAEAANNACLKSFHEAIRARHDILIDRTNVDRASRKKFLGKLKAAGYEIVGFEVKCDPEELKRRNEARKEFGRSIPENVMASFASRYESPSASEGFDHVLKD